MAGGVVDEGDVVVPIGSFVGELIELGSLVVVLGDIVLDDELGDDVLDELPRWRRDECVVDWLDVVLSGVVVVVDG